MNLADHDVPILREFTVTGIIFLVLGTSLCGWSGWLYHRVRRDIDSDRYEPAARAVTMISAMVVCGGLVIVASVGLEHDGA